MKAKHYKTLKGFLSQTLYGQINYIDFHKGIFYHKKLGWIRFCLKGEEVKRAYRLMASAVYSSGSKVDRLMCYHGENHGILKGITLSLSKNCGLRASYCAGQYYPNEIRTIQGIFRNGN